MASTLSGNAICSSGVGLTIKNRRYIQYRGELISIQPNKRTAYLDILFETKTIPIHHQPFIAKIDGKIEFWDVGGNHQLRLVATPKTGVERLETYCGVVGRPVFSVSANIQKVTKKKDSWYLYLELRRPDVDDLPFIIRYEFPSMLTLRCANLSSRCDITSFSDLARQQFEKAATTFEDALAVVTGYYTTYGTNSDKTSTMVTIRGCSASLVAKFSTNTYSPIKSDIPPPLFLATISPGLPVTWILNPAANGTGAIIPDTHISSLPEYGVSSSSAHRSSPPPPSSPSTSATSPKSSPPRGSARTEKAGNPTYNLKRKGVHDEAKSKRQRTE